MLKIEHEYMLFGGLQANKDISFKVNRGEIFGIIGPNGAGKTTLFNVISGFYKPTSGKVLFNNEEIQGKTSNIIAYKGIARTYQNINLFNNLSVLDNILIGCHSKTKAGLFDALFNTKNSQYERKMALEKCNQLLKLLNISQWRNSIAKSLPYGDQRRLEIARALASEPQLLLLDEPAAGMNPTEKEVLTETIIQLRESGYTILLVEHNMKLVMKVCDQIFVMDHGCKIAQGTPKEIQNNPVVISAYLGGFKNEYS